MVTNIRNWFFNDQRGAGDLATAAVMAAMVAFLFVILDINDRIRVEQQVHLENAKRFATAINNEIEANLQAKTAGATIITSTLADIYDANSTFPGGALEAASEIVALSDINGILILAGNDPTATRVSDSGDVTYELANCKAELTMADNTKIVYKINLAGTPDGSTTHFYIDSFVDADSGATGAHTDVANFLDVDPTQSTWVDVSASYE